MTITFYINVTVLDFTTFPQGVNYATLNVLIAQFCLTEVKGKIGRKDIV